MNDETQTEARLKSRISVNLEASFFSCETWVQIKVLWPHTINNINKWRVGLSAEFDGPVFCCFNKHSSGFSGSKWFSFMARSLYLSLLKFWISNWNGGIFEFYWLLVYKVLIPCLYTVVSLWTFYLKSLSNSLKRWKPTQNTEPCGVKNDQFFNIYSKYL